jgi:pSer/pThr/pTyr-binding forkhead associated (FHA) protein
MPPTRGVTAPDPDNPPTIMTDIGQLLSLPPARTLVLRLTEGPGAPREFLIAKGKSIVGRGSAADISVPCRTLSRKHAMLTLEGGEVTCRDLDSRNGVALNGLRMHSAVLRDGDMVQLGDVVFTYLERSA